MSAKRPRPDVNASLFDMTGELLVEVKSAVDIQKIGQQIVFMIFSMGLNTILGGIIKMTSKLLVALESIIYV